MCGIVGLYLKNPALESQLGKLFEPMLESMTGRGPDSAGFAIYGDEVQEGWVKLTLQSTDEAFIWDTFIAELATELNAELDWFTNATAAVIKVKADEDTVRTAITKLAPQLKIMSAGLSIEILKGIQIFITHRWWCQFTFNAI
jgi:methylamine---glutamate N-methyltransferase subunit A